MELATDLETQGSSNTNNATIEVKMDNIGELETQRLIIRIEEVYRETSFVCK